MARVYATPSDLTEWGVELDQAEARGMIRRASALVENHTITARYRVDGDGMPTEPRLVEAFRDAVCAVVAWWEETGNASGAAGQYTDVSLGSLSLRRAPSAGGHSSAQAARIAPEAVQILATAGLLSQAPGSPGGDELCEYRPSYSPTE
ncbi:hypothetical protein [Nocardiopsis alba]|uniref:hypothetical protein n=1 Tax=Nocardiopsis alba TaxID=53437 RepID=UPI0035DAC491